MYFLEYLITVLKGLCYLVIIQPLVAWFSPCGWCWYECNSCLCHTV